MTLLYFIINFLITVITAAVINESNYSDYENARDSLMRSEDNSITGGSLCLNAKELRANEIFMEHKCNELEEGLINPDCNAAAMHFFNAKQLIDNSKVFKFLQKMPKGTVLHMHNSASVSSKWVVRNIFSMPGLLRCTNKEGVIILTFRRHPKKHGCATDYKVISDERQTVFSSDNYDTFLENIINLYTPLPQFEYKSINTVWKKFQNMFESMSDVLRFLPAYRAYHWQMLEELYNDNIMYAELRLNFKELYDINGCTYPPKRALSELIDLTQMFIQNRPKFLGLKVIYSVNRNASIRVIRKNFEQFKKFHSLQPDYVIGFDLVGQEDIGKPLHNFVNILKDKPNSSKFFFHAGETNWYGALTDSNLFDAILLNTTRIGHGYALIKHPLLLNAVYDQNIAIEVSPISNQVLNLVSDLRNHPGAYFISQDIPTVICNDDPGFWSAKGLSYDFYYAIMSLAPNTAGLQTLKQLVWNSIRYATLNQDEYDRANKMLQSQWDNFINDVLNGLVV